MFLIPRNQFQIRKVKNKGRGVFVLSSIEAGTVIGDYLGRVIKAGQEKESDKGLYYLWLNDKATISPDPKKIGVHLMNNSCSPNCAMYPHKGHTLIFATRKVFPGEELTFSYLLDPPPDEGPCTDNCFCGSPICSGTMHVSQEISDKWSKFVEQKQGKYFKQKIPVKFGEELPRLARYPKKVGDNSIYNLFGSDTKVALTMMENKLSSLKTIRNLIRLHGRKLKFKKINLIILGVMGNVLVIKNLR